MRRFILVPMLFIMLLLSACKVEMYGQLSESDANLALAHLMGAGIVAEKRPANDNQFGLFVSESQFAQAVELLTAKGIPKKQFMDVNEIFQSDGLVSSPVKEWARYNFAVSQELAATISSMQGVISADVHIAKDRSDNVFEKDIPPTASVMLQTDADQMRSNLIPEIKKLVSFAVADVSYDRVNVVVSEVDFAQNTSSMVSMMGFTMSEKAVPVIRMLFMIGVVLALVCLILGYVLFSNARKTKLIAGQQ